MSRFSISQQVRIAGLRADEARRAVVSRALASPMLRWRYRIGASGEILFVPSDPRTADYSFYTEIAVGHWGLAGHDVRVPDARPLKQTDAPREWLRELHGFSWLRHIEASEDPEAQRLAQRVVFDWIVRLNAPPAAAVEADVVARRLVSWLCHANLILDGAAPSQFDAFINALDRHIVDLAATWRAAPAGQPRLFAITAMTLGYLVLSGHDRRLPEAVRHLEDELRAQVIDAGGHISRNSGVMAELLLDLLPLSQCFQERALERPAALQQSISVLLRALHHLRMGDGALARFNGPAPSSSADLAMLFAYSDLGDRRDTGSVLNGYARLEAGPSIVVSDVAEPPPLASSGQAHAGCLSFEWSFAEALVLTNAGSPPSEGCASGAQRAAARATASHNTLQLGETSSSELVNDVRLQTHLGNRPIRYPDRVKLMSAANDSSTIEARHNGYDERFGLFHRRRLSLSADGTRLEGDDWLGGSSEFMRLPQDIPFSIHFHLPADATVRRDRSGDCVTIELANGICAALKTDSFLLTIEPALDHASAMGPTATEQIVLRGSTFGETHIRWSAAILNSETAAA